MNKCLLHTVFMSLSSWYRDEASQTERTEFLTESYLNLAEGLTEERFLELKHAFRDCVTPILNETLTKEECSHPVFSRLVSPTTVIVPVILPESRSTKECLEKIGEFYDLRLKDIGDVQQDTQKTQKVRQDLLAFYTNIFEKAQTSAYTSYVNELRTGPCTRKQAEYIAKTFNTRLVFIHSNQIEYDYEGENKHDSSTRCLLIGESPLNGFHLV